MMRETPARLIKRLCKTLKNGLGDVMVGLARIGFDMKCHPCGRYERLEKFLDERVIKTCHAAGVIPSEFNHK